MHLLMTRPWFKIPLALCLALCCLLCFRPLHAEARAAHAQYDHSSPAANARLPAGSALTSVQVWFSEAIDPLFSSLRVYNDRRVRVDRDDSQSVASDPYQMRISLRAPLPDGAYTVVFENVSAEDGHHVEGAFSFVIGGGALPSSPGLSLAQSQGIDANFNIWSILLRWLNDVGMALLVGCPVFLLLVWRPTRSLVRKDIGAALHTAWQLVEKRVRHILLASLVLLMIGWIGMLLYQASIATQSAAWEVFGNQALTHVLLRSRFGLIWLGRGCLLLVLTGYWLLWRKRRGFLPAPWLWFLLLLGLALMLTTSLNAHAAGNLLAWLLLPADVIHLACTGFWLGGLAGLVLTLPPIWRALLPGTGERTRLLAALIPRFSRLALFSVGLLAATGTLMAVVQLGSWQALTGSPYGLTLLLKLGLFLVLLLLGAANLLRISPRMRRFARKPGETAGAAASFQAGTLQRRFRRIIVSECAVALLLLGSVGALTSLSPPPPAQRTTTPHWQGTVADLTYQLAITPGISGPNAFEVLLTQQNGSPLVKTDEVLLRFQMLDMAMGIQEVSLQPVARQPGHYAATNSVLSMAGHWRITLIIRRAGFDESQVSFSQNVV